MLHPERDPRAVTYLTSDGVKVTVIPPNDVPRLFRACIYCRVSTMHPDQLESLAAQLGYYRKYVNSRRDMVLVGEYCDTKSGRSIHARAQFEKMIQDCMEGKIDVIVTKSVSRFGRNTEDTLSVLRQLKEKNINVIFENDGIQSISEDGELMITLMSAIAQAESEKRSKNVKWGIRQSTTNPDAHIFARPCYGYRKDDDGKLVIVEEEAENVRLIFDLYLSGYSVLSITRELQRRGIKTPTGKETWPKRSIDMMLQNEKYIGDVLVYKTYCDEYPQKRRISNEGYQDQVLASDHHPAIIEKEKFLEVQAERARRSNIVVNADGTKKRKDTHYSSKSAGKSENLHDSSLG